MYFRKQFMEVTPEMCSGLKDVPESASRVGGGGLITPKHSTPQQPGITGYTPYGGWSDSRSSRFPQDLSLNSNFYFIF